MRTETKYGRYEITEDGHVYNLDYRGQGERKEVPISYKNSGYAQVGLYDPTQKKTIIYSLHRLLAELFIPNPDNLPCVGHMDDNCRHNEVSNLYWTTYEENNNRFAWKERHKGKYKGKVKVAQIDLTSGELIATFDSMTEAAEAIGCSVGCISLAVNGGSRQAKGYKWEKILGDL